MEQVFEAVLPVSGDKAFQYPDFVARCLFGSNQDFGKVELIAEQTILIHERVVRVHSLSLKLKAQILTARLQAEQFGLKFRE